MMPYPASYISRMMQAVKRLPPPYWATYLGLFVLESLILMIAAWVDGWLPALTFNPILFLFPLWLWAPLGIMTYLNDSALVALASFSLLLDADEAEMERLRYEFTTLPRRPVLLSGAIWTGVYFLLTYIAFDDFYVGFGVGALLMVLVILAGLPTFFTGGTITYQIFRQLRLVNRTVRQSKPFNLFQLEPVYAFSGLTARAGGAVIAMLSLTLLVFPVELTTAPILAVMMSQGILAVAAFVLPLWLVNRRLVTLKRRLQAALDVRVEATLERLHRALDQHELGEVGQFNSALSSLNAEREVLNRIPTWPWRTETLTSFLSALVLPVILFVIQLVIGRLLGE